MTNNQFADLEQKIEITFRNKTLVQNAFIHRSYLNENKAFYLPSNEKLEFLGDSVLSLITSIYLFKNYPELTEGDYTDIKAAIVRTESLAIAANNLDLGRYLQLSKGEEKGHGRKNTNILADTFEALVACIFIDIGFDAAYEFVKEWLFKDRLDEIVSKNLYLSPKSRLQEVMQAQYKMLPEYRIIEETGPEHQKEFTVAVSLNGTILATATGNSKKSAEEAAAKKALEKAS